MASLHFSGLAIASTAAAPMPSFRGLRFAPATFSLPSSVGSLNRRGSGGFVVKAATVIAPKYTSIKPLGDRVLIKIKNSEEATVGGILLPSTAQSKPQSGEVVAVGEGRTVGNNKLAVGLQTGSQVLYSKYAGTELELNGASHIVLKEDDIVGILEAEDVKDLKPLSDRILIKVAEAEEKTAGGLLLTEASKEKPSIGTVVAVGPGAIDEEGNRKPLTVKSGSTVLYSKYAGNEFKGADGTAYIVLKASDVLAILS